MITFHRAYPSNPGFISSKNIDKIDNYPYDNILYKANIICPTAKICKVAGSKYDRMTKRHVASFDHYCAWIDQLVGEENYRIFLLFLLVQVAIFWYGTAILYHIFKNEIEELQLFQARFNAQTKMEVEANLWLVTQFLCARHGPMVRLLLLMGVMTTVFNAFLLFHLHLIARGMTANEFCKWLEPHRNKIKKNGSSTSNKLQKFYNDTNPMQPNGCIDADELNSEYEKLSDDADQSLLNIYNLLKKSRKLSFLDPCNLWENVSMSTYSIALILKIPP
jgi:palmitoyltransferase